MAKDKKASVNPVGKVQAIKPAPIVNEGDLYDTSTKNVKALLERLEAVAAQGKTVQVEYQKVALSIIKHLALHGDIMLVRRMLEGFPESLRKDSMMAWLDRFSNVKFLVDDKGKVTGIVYDKTKKLQLGLAMETVWWKAAKATEYKIFALEIELEALYTRTVSKLPKLNEDKGDHVDAAVLNALGALVRLAKTGDTKDLIESVKQFEQVKNTPKERRKKAA